MGRSCVATAAARHRVRGVDSSQMDVTDPDAVSRVFSDFRPQAVLHCAAYTRVDDAEREPARATRVNADGTGWVARASSEHGAVLAYVSTDYVFDGERKRPYREEDPTGPLSHYGRTKLDGERRVAAHCPEEHLIFRTGWLYGTGKGFVDWLSQRLREEEPIRLVADQKGSPTYVVHAAEAMLRLLEGGHRGLFHFVNKGETSWLGLGEAVLELLGASNVPLEAIAASDLGRPARRPAYSALAVDKFEQSVGEHVVPWRQALARYLICANRGR